MVDGGTASIRVGRACLLWKREIACVMTRPCNCSHVSTYLQYLEGQHDPTLVVLDGMQTACGSRGQMSELSQSAQA
jgi:hypothetical protein